jgi:hypothetical protein
MASRVADTSSRNQQANGGACAGEERAWGDRAAGRARSGRGAQQGCGRETAPRGGGAPRSAAARQLARRQVARRARAIWEARGCPPGYVAEHWIEAETQLQREFDWVL